MILTPTFHVGLNQAFGRLISIAASFTAAILLSLIGISALAQVPVTFNTVGTTNWNCPDGVTSIRVECIGGGGSGGTRTTNGGSGGGGGGAYASSILTVVPGDTYVIVVGDGGSSGNPGGSSSFNGGTVLAVGGSGVGNNAIAGGTGGAEGACTGDDVASGGNGGSATSSSSSNGGGGGGAAGAGGDGSDGGLSGGGAGNGTYSGSGPGGATSQGNGTIGNIYGSGGSGAKRTSSGTRTGGAGAQGIVIITMLDALWQNPIIGSNPNGNNPYVTGDITSVGVSVSGIGRGGGLSSQNANDRYNASGWPTNGTIVITDDCYTFTLTPASGQMINFDRVLFTGQLSTGNANHYLRSSLDGYASNISSAATSGTTPNTFSFSLSGADFQEVIEPITFRLYTTNVSASGTQFSINDFAFIGDVVPMNVLWTNPITGTNPNTSNPYTTGQTHDADITVSGIGRGAGLSGVNSNDRYNANNWSTSGTLNTANEDYFEFTLTPNSGHLIDFLAFSFAGQRNNGSNSPEDFAVRTNLDNFGSNIWSINGYTSTSEVVQFVNLNDAAFDHIFNPITFRIYGWDSGGSSNQYSINNFVFFGEVRELVPATIASFSPTASCPGSGDEVVITGTEFEYVTAVEFNGVSASYTVNSTTQITATLPSGATSGQITVVTAAGTAYSSGNFTVYEGEDDTTLLTDDFEDANTTGWTINNGGWSASNSSPLTGSYSLSGSSSLFNERWISRPLAGAPVDFTEGDVRWRFNCVSTGGSSSSNNDIYLWLASSGSDVGNGSSNGYGMKFEGTTIRFGVKSPSWTELFSHNAGSGTTGVEVTRTADGLWIFSTDDNGGFDNLVERGATTIPDNTIISGSYFGAFLDNPLASLTLKLDDIEILQVGSCHEIYYSQGTGNYSDVIWSREPVGTPVAVTGTEVISFIVQDTHSIAVDTDWTAKNVSIENGGQLTFSAAHILDMYGDFDVAGSLTAGAGTIGFHGDVDQSFTSASALTLNHVVINNTGHEVTFPSNVNVNIQPNAIVTVPSGTLNTSDNLTLRSTVDGSASIGTLGATGSVIGEVTMQRYIPNLTTPPLGGQGSWVPAGTPVVGATLQDWNQTIITTGFTGADFSWAQYPFVNIQWYDETETGDLSVGYQPVDNITNTLHADRGYFVYMLSNVQNISAKGTIQQGSFNVPLNYTNNGTPVADGWNLLVNQYPSEVDFKQIAEAGSGIAAYYVYDDETKNYKTYHTISNGTAPRYIASSQSFFVKAGGAGAYLRYEEAFKSSNGLAFERNQGDTSFVAFSLSNSISKDECVINFNESATAAYEWTHDAEKLASMTTQAVECSVLTEDGKMVSVDSRPASQENMSIPVFLKIPTAGTTYFRIEETHNLPFGSCLMVEDLVSGISIPVMVGEEFEIITSEPYSGNRLLIHLSPSVQIAETHPLCYGDDTGVIQVNTPQGEWTVELFDASGINVGSGTNAIVFENLMAGEYTLSASNTLDECPASVQNILLAEPSEVFIEQSLYEVDACNASSTGAIAWHVVNTTSYAYSITNSTGEVVMSGTSVYPEYLVTGLSGDVYEVELTSTCATLSFTADLNDPAIVTTNILSEDLEILVEEEEYTWVTIGQNNTNATQISWTLSNGFTSAEESFSYGFLEAGEYTLTLEASNGQCAAQDSIQIVVERSVDIASEEKKEGITFVQTGDILQVWFNQVAREDGTIRAFDAAGREVLNQQVASGAEGMMSLNIKELAPGVYTITVTLGTDLFESEKILKQ